MFWKENYPLSVMWLSGFENMATEFERCQQGLKMLKVITFGEWVQIIS